MVVHIVSNCYRERSQRMWTNTVLVVPLCGDRGDLMETMLVLTGKVLYMVVLFVILAGRQLVRSN